MNAFEDGKYSLDRRTDLNSVAYYGRTKESGSRSRNAVRLLSEERTYFNIFFDKIKAVYARELEEQRWLCVMHVSDILGQTDGENRGKTAAVMMAC